jgi:thioredoxin reductase (NADPH)
VPDLDIRCGKRVTDIAGEDGVSGVVIEDAAGGNTETLDAYGVLVHVGVAPDTDCIDALLDTDDGGFAETGEDLASDVPGLFLAGDIRRGSPRTVAAAIEDGARAAATAQAFLAGGGT